MPTIVFALVYALPVLTIAALIWVVYRCRQGKVAPWATPKETLALLIPFAIVLLDISAYATVAYYAPQRQETLGAVFKWIGAIAAAAVFIIGGVVTSAMRKRPELPDALRSRIKTLPVMCPIGAVLILIFAALL